MATRLARITQRAREHPREVFTNLYQHLDEELLAECFAELKDGRAPGVDGVTKDAYAENLRGNLEGLVARLRSQRYRPRPSRRTGIPKLDGGVRQLGVPCLEDKLVQRAVARLLERVYEESFMDFSYGFRPGRSCHDALRALSRAIGTRKVNWVVEADITGFFDHVEHSWMTRMLEERVRDPRLLRLVARFLAAGVMAEGRRLDTPEGTPQGGVISPLLGNVYLHYVLDLWFERVVRPRLRGEAYLVRYADDFAVCFEREEDARRFLEVLGKRLGKFGLTLKPSKTRMFRFGRFAKRDSLRAGERVATFDFLGFTHYGGTSRKGRFKLKWRTAGSRLRAKLRAMKDWLGDNLTLPLRELWETINRKLNGHYAYFGVSDNWKSLMRFRWQTAELALRAFNRRSQRPSFSREAFIAYLDRFGLATPRRTINLNSAFV